MKGDGEEISGLAPGFLIGAAGPWWYHELR